MTSAARQLRNEFPPTFQVLPAPVRRLVGWRAGAALPGTLRDCSLAVPTYRRPAAVVKLLELVCGLPDRPGEVVIVDGSTDVETARAVTEWAFRAELPFALIYVRSPVGLTRQRNVGVDASRGEYVFFLDDDCVPQPGYFAAIQRVFAADRVGRVGGIGGTITNEINRPMNRRWQWRMRLRLAPRGESGRYYPTATSVPRALAAPFTGTRPTDMLPGGASAWRRNVFEQHRFSMFFNGYSQGEDLDFSMRVGRDWQLLWCGDAHTLHCPEPGGRPRSFRKGAMEVRNRYFVWKRHTPRPTFGCRGLLWLDFGFIFVCDVGTGLFGHAAGVAAGMASCLVWPPRHVEPPARREYEFDLHELKP